MTEIRIPPQLARAVQEDGIPARHDWLAALPGRVVEIASAWSLDLGEPYLPGGECAWVAPARNPNRDELALKVAWRHPEAEHEADALRHWNGRGAIRCHVACTLEDTTALLLERYWPGSPRMASLLDVDPQRVTLWLFARCAQESLDDSNMREPARRLAP